MRLEREKEVVDLFDARETLGGKECIYRERKRGRERGVLRRRKRVVPGWMTAMEQAFNCWSALIL